MECVSHRTEPQHLPPTFSHCPLILLGLCLPDSRRKLEAYLLEKASWQVPRLGPSAQWLAGLN